MKNGNLGAALSKYSGSMPQNAQLEKVAEADPRFFTKLLVGSLLTGASAASLYHLVNYLRTAKAIGTNEYGTSGLDLDIDLSKAQKKLPEKKKLRKEAQGQPSWLESFWHVPLTVLGGIPVGYWLADSILDEYRKAAIGRKKREINRELDKELLEAMQSTRAFPKEASNGSTQIDIPDVKLEEGEGPSTMREFMTSYPRVALAILGSLFLGGGYLGFREAYKRYAAEAPQRQKLEAIKRYNRLRAAEKEKRVPVYFRNPYIKESTDKSAEVKDAPWLYSPGTARPKGPVTRWADDLRAGTKVSAPEAPGWLSVAKGAPGMVSTVMQFLTGKPGIVQRTKARAKEKAFEAGTQAIEEWASDPKNIERVFSAFKKGTTGALKSYWDRMGEYGKQFQFTPYFQDWWNRMGRYGDVSALNPFR
jgi:hypothetical protein